MTGSPTRRVARKSDVAKAAAGRRNVNHLSRQRAEVLDDEPVPVEHNGVTYHVPSTLDWPVDVTQKLAEDDIPGALVDILGQEQWDAFRTSGGPGGTRARFRDLRAVFDAVMAFESGESSASSASLRNTGTLSRRTVGGTTGATSATSGAAG